MPHIGTYFRHQPASLEIWAGSNVGFADGHVEWVKRENYIFSYEMSQDDNRTGIGFDY